MYLEHILHVDLIIMINSMLWIIIYHHFYLAKIKIKYIK